MLNFAPHFRCVTASNTLSHLNGISGMRITSAPPASPELAHALQNFVKTQIAPYKYPRVIEFVTALPRTETGKVQRFRLREPR